MTRLPPRDPEKSVHDWNQWGKTAPRIKVPERVYEQHVPRTEKVAVEKPKKVKRK